MKKVRCVIILFLLVFFLFPTVAYAKDAEGLWQDFCELLPEGEIENGEKLTESVGPGSVFSLIFSKIGENSVSIIGFFSAVLGVTLLISLCESGAFFESKNLSPYMSAAVTTVAGVLIFSSVYPLILSIKESMEVASGFFSGLVPIVTGICASSGSIGSAGVHAANMNLILGLVSGVLSGLLLPIALLIFILALSDGLSAGQNASLAKGAKSTFLWALGIVTAIIMGGVSMQSIIASATDSAYMRAAKYASSGLIPIVGGTVSGALGTLVGGLSYVKDTVGVGAVAFIVGISIGPFVSLILYRLALSVSISFMDFVGISGGVRCFSAFRAALDAIIAVFITSVLIYVFELSVFVKCGVASFG